MSNALFRKGNNSKGKASTRGGLSNFCRAKTRARGSRAFKRAGAAAILLVFALGAQTPDPYSIKAGNIESLIKCAERQAKRYPKSAEPYSDAAGSKTLIFKDANLQKAVAQMRILASDLKKLSAEMAKSPTKMENDKALLQAVSGRFLGSLTRMHVLYAIGAHASAAGAAAYSFDNLDSLNLTLEKTAAFPVFQKNPFNTQHKSATELEFSLSDEERVLAEDAAVSNPKDAHEYAKFLQHSVLREGFVNRWAVRRLTSQTYFGDSKIASCGPELLSFRLGSDKLITGSPLYRELVSTDRFAEVRKLTPKLAEQSMNRPLAEPAFYVSLVKTTLGSEPEYKKLMSGVAAGKIDDWNTKVAQYVASMEQDDWQVYAQDVILSATMYRDESAPAAVAQRMAEHAHARRAKAVREQLWIFANGLLNVQNRDAFEAKVEQQLDKTREAWIQDQYKAFLPVAQRLDDPKNRAVIAYERLEEMKKKVFDAAEPAIPAAYEMAFFEKAGMDYETSRWTEAAKVKAMLGGKLVAGMTLAPITPQDLELYFMGMMNHWQYAQLEHVMDKQKEVSEVISQFFKELGEAFEKEVAKTPDLVLTPENTPLARLAVEKAYAIQKKLYEEYKAAHNGKEYSALDETLKIQPLKKDQLARQPKLVPTFDENAMDNKIVVEENGKLVVKEKSPERPHPPMLILQTPEEIEKAKEEGDAKECGEFDGLYGLLGNAPKQKEKKPVGTMLIGDDSDQPMNKIPAVEGVFGVMHLQLHNFDRAPVMKQLYPASILTAPVTKSAQFMPYLFEHMTFAQAKFGLSFSQSALLQKKWRAANLPTGEDERTTMQYLADAYEPSTFKVNKTKALAIIGDAVWAVRRDDKLETFCAASTKTAAILPDENFKNLFRASASTRMTINEKGKFDAFEEKLRKLSRTGKEAFQEDVLFSHAMMIFFAVLMIVSFFVMPLLTGVVAQVAATILSIINIVSFPLIVAGTYTRWSVNYFEKPAQLKFQEAVANSYLGDTRTMMGDLKQIASREKIEGEKASLKFNAWTEPIWTAMDFFFTRAIVKDLRIATGSLVAQGGKTLGLTTRGKWYWPLAKPPGQVKVVKSYADLVGEEGFFKGTTKKAGEFWDGLGRWTAKYQSFTMEEVVAALRGKVTKLLPENHAQSIPEIEQAIDYWNVRLTKAMKKLAPDSKLKGTGLVKEGEPFTEIDPSGVAGFVESPNLTLFSMYPKALIGAFKSGKILQFSKRWGEFVETMREMRVLYITDRLAKFKTLIEKMEFASQNNQTVEELVAGMSEEELGLLYEAGRMSKFFGGKYPLADRAATLFKPGPLNKLVPYFEATENIRMKLKPLQPGLKLLTPDELKNYEPTHYYDPATDTYVPNEDADMKAWYRNMEDFDGTSLSSKEAEELRSRLNKRLGI